MRLLIPLLLPLLLALSLAAPLQAATLYAKTCASGCSWASASTWSTTGSAGVDSSGPPTSADTVILEAGSGAVVVDAVGAAALTVSMTAGTGDYASTLSCSGVWTLSLNKTTTATVWAASSAGTVSFTGCTIVLVAPTAANTLTFAGAGKTYGSLQVTPTEAGTVVITGNNTFETLIFADLLPSGTLTFKLPASGTTTVGNITTGDLGELTAHPVSVVSSTGGVATTLTKPNGTVNVNSLTVTDVTATGGATWCAYSATANGGGNTGWSFTACPLIPRQLVLGVQ